MAANGDAKAFSRLYETIYGAMYYTAFYSLVTDADAIEAVQGAARDGFKTIGKLRSEESFRVFMMRTLCARIKVFFKDYGGRVLNRDTENVVKEELFALDNIDRMCTVMHVVARFTPDEISQYTGMSKRAVKKRIVRSLETLNAQ